MKEPRSIALALMAGCISIALAPTAQADSWNKKTILTVGESIQMPSCCTSDHTVTLPPGKYVMVLMDSMSDRHIVRVFAEDEKTVITTVLAIPNYRLQPTGDTVLQYWEVPAGQPKELRAWFYPGDNFGQEFAYHKNTAAQIAAFAKTPVPAIAMDTTAVEDLKIAPLVAVDESGKTTELAATTPPAPEAVTVAQAVAPEPTVQVEPVQQQTVVAEPAPMQTLPQTASELPLLGLAGLVLLAVAVVFEVRSRRQA
jgi:hypothetical protein